MEKKNNKGELDVQSILDTFEKYLIADVKTMLSIKDKDSGGLGFSCLLVILIGIELLGILLSAKKDNAAFEKAWEFMAKSGGDNYDSIHLRKILYDFARNGIAHTFSVKRGLQVHLHDGDNLKFTPEGILHINCSKFFEVFEKAYLECNKYLLSDAAANVSQDGVSKLMSIINQDQTEIEEYKKELEMKNKYQHYLGTSASIPYSPTTTISGSGTCGVSPGYFEKVK